MKDDGFGSLVRRGLSKKVKFQGDRRPRAATYLEVMMLQLVYRAVHGDSKALRQFLKHLKIARPAPAKEAMHLYSLVDGNVIDPDNNVLGPLSAFPHLPDVAGPKRVPKEWLIPDTALIEKESRTSAKTCSGNEKQNK